MQMATNNNNALSGNGNIDTGTFNSSNLQSMEYDNSKKTLRLTFNINNAVYEYYNVPQIVVYELQQAASAGSYFHKFIRDRYSYKRIS